MKIAVNTFSVDSEKMGVKTYLTNLLSALSEIDHKNKYYIFLSKSNQEVFRGLSRDNFKKIVVPIPIENTFVRILCDQLVLPLYLKKYNLDILFSPQNVCSLLTNIKQVSVLQLAYRPLLKGMSKGRRAYYELLLPRSIQKSDKVIAVSSFMKDMLLEDFGVDSSKIRVVYEGIDPTFCDTKKKKSPSVEIGSDPKPYILYVGSLFSYKRVEYLIRAFSKFKKKYNTKHKLLLVGRGSEDRVNDLKECVSKEGMIEQVIFKGEIKHNLTPCYYRGADVFVYPSRVESFGLPVLEAMACGVPVIASDRASLPEVVGSAGLVVDVEDINELSEAIYRTVTNDKVRLKLIKRGRERVRFFSWERVAKETLEVFKKTHDG